jgi:hypothetical protein
MSRGRQAEEGAAVKGRGGTPYIPDLGGQKGFVGVFGL